MKRKVFKNDIDSGTSVTASGTNEMRKLDCVAFLAGVDLVLSPFIWFLVFPDEALPFGGWVFLSGGKFFAFFILWGISFYLADKVVTPKITLQVAAGLLFVLILCLLLCMMIFLEDGKVESPGIDALLFAARALLPTVITYLLLLMKIRWRAKRLDA